jgi:Ni/Fe-hydrogenase subunit HybB-like protein
MRLAAVLAAVAIDAALFCVGYVLTSSLFTTGMSAIFVVDPRIFPDGTFNARVVVAASFAAGGLLVVAWRTVHHLCRRRART